MLGVGVKDGRFWCGATVMPHPKPNLEDYFRQRTTPEKNPIAKAMPTAWYGRARMALSVASAPLPRARLISSQAALVSSTAASQAVSLVIENEFGGRSFAGEHRLDFGQRHAGYA